MNVCAVFRVWGQNVLFTQFVPLAWSSIKEYVQTETMKCINNICLRSCNVYTCKFETIHEDDILKFFNKMDNKSSSGYDMLSNKIIKAIKKMKLANH